jgi:pSer/pThr/pTyr-binding forkhead associated (FHA) protein
VSQHSLDLFLEACGAAGPLHLGVEALLSQESGRRLVPQPFALVGRHPKADVVLDHWQISQRHAYLQVLDGKVFGVDLGSRTGMSWDDGPRRSGWLDPGQAVRIGPFDVRLLRGTPPDSSPTAGTSVARPPLPGVSLEFLNVAAQRPPWRVAHALTLVGQSPECKIRLAAPTVSRFHASLVHTPRGVWVIDLLGKEGITVNGAALRFAKLEDGDELEIGKFRIRVHYDRAPAAGLHSPDLPDPARTVLELPAASPGLPAVANAPSPPGGPVARWRLPTPPQLVEPLPVRTLGGSALVPAQVPADLVESLLVPLTNQFNVMQQQMFDQFQQTLLMMVQMFSALHRDQVGQIHEELDRLNQLTEELRTLQAELSRHRQAAPDRASSEPPAPAAPSETAAEPASVARPAEEPPPVAATRKDSSNREPPAGEQPARQANGAAAAPAVPPAGEPDPQRSGQSPEDIHAWLCGQIASIQQERQSRWQRLLQFLVGGRPGEPVP